DAPESRDKTVGLGLAALDVLRGDNIEKQLAKSGAPKNRFGLGAQCAGHDHQRKSSRAVAHELRRAGVENFALSNLRLIDGGLARDQTRDALLARIFPILAQHGREAIVIVKSNQPRGVFVERNFDPLGTQNVIKRREMQRLSIDQRPIKIEQNSANHARAKLSRAASL